MTSIEASENEYTALKNEIIQLNGTDNLERFRTIFEYSKLAAKIISPDLVIIQVNLALVKLLGYDFKDQLIGTRILDYSPQHNHEHWKSLQEHLWHGESPFFILETCLIKKDKSEVWCKIISILFPDAVGTLGYTVIEDVTEQRMLRLQKEEFISVASDELLEVSEKQKKVIHDIRNPITGIIGLAEIISEQGDTNKMDEVLEFINLIHKSGRTILELADEIMTIEEVYAGQKDAFTLLEFKDKLQTLYQPQARNKNITFRINTLTDMSPVPFQKNKLLQITSNLISNAMKFTPQNGEVTVDLNLNKDTTPNRLEISVSDSGRGMDTHLIEAILQGNASSTNGTGGEQGYGFGLALVKRLVNILKGTITIKSIPGAGSSFNIVLPQVGANDSDHKT